jgi:hypothetical protein
MENEKKGFLYYFEFYEIIQHYPPEVRLAMYDATVEFAKRTAHGEGGAAMERTLQHFPQMTEDQQAVFRLNAGRILRDTEKWFSQRSAYLRRGTAHSPRESADAAERSGAAMSEYIRRNQAEFGSAAQEKNSPDGAVFPADR